MIVDGEHYRTIWPDDRDGDHEGNMIKIIDQRYLPHKFVIEDLKSVEDAANAIKEMHVRGAGLIGATAGYGMHLATKEAIENNYDFEKFLYESANLLKDARPTAVNLEWAVDRQMDEIFRADSLEERAYNALETANDIADEDAEYCMKIGEHGVRLIEEIAEYKEYSPVNILTHCNAGWLAFVDYGSATSPIYKAHEMGIDVNVIVDETRPRNQGARLTAWELGQQGVPYKIVVDNVGGHLMQRGNIDMVLVGTDRTTRTGDVCNKIGTYLKALAAYDNDIPFYVALPSSSFDWNVRDGFDITIEERGAEEVKYIQGLHGDSIENILLTPEDAEVLNYGFDVTPSKYVTSLITERGVCDALEENILELFPEYSF